jgi:threonine dehydrogenase-like Zn-dependent dehydrogenase
MKALVFTPPGGVAIADVATPIPSPGETLVHVKAVGICGSDLHGVSDGLYPFPVVLGHEFAGVTDDGRRVAVNPQVPCRSCPSCRAGVSNLCTANNIVGITRDGGVAETVAVPDDRLVTLPEAGSYTSGAMAEVVANALHALARGGGARNKTVGVLGAGPIGLATVMCARAHGAAHVAVTDLSEKRLRVAADLGADATGAALDGGQFDLVVDAVGATTTRSASLTALRPGGTTVWIGVNQHTAAFAASPELVLAERGIVGSFAYTDDEFRAAVDIAATATFDWVSTYTLNQAGAVFADLAAGRSAVVKAHFTPEGGQST